MSYFVGHSKKLHASLSRCWNSFCSWQMSYALTGLSCSLQFAVCSLQFATGATCPYLLS